MTLKSSTKTSSLIIRTIYLKKGLSVPCMWLLVNGYAHPAEDTLDGRVNNGRYD